MESNNMLEACKVIECVIDGKAGTNSLVKFFPYLEGINIENCVKEAVKGIRLEKRSWLYMCTKSFKRCHSV